MGSKYTVIRIITSTLLIIALSAFSSDSNNEPVLSDADAKKILTEIRSYRGEKPVLVNFWATWCGPCVEEFPYIMSLYSKYEGEFKLIFVSGDFREQRQEAQKFLKAQGVDFESYFKVGSDNEFIKTISDKWSGALPFTMVFSKEGQLSSAWEGKAELSKFEEKLLDVLNHEKNK